MSGYIFRTQPGPVAVSHSEGPKLHFSYHTWKEMVDMNDTLVPRFHVAKFSHVSEKWLPSHYINSQTLRSQTATRPSQKKR